MKLHTRLTTVQLMRRLEEALHKEGATWQPSCYVPSEGTSVGSAERDQIVHWLCYLTDKFHFYPETFNLCVALFDRFLQLVKTRPKYLPCIGIATFYLAAKTLEEDEVVPDTTELVEESQCGCSISDVCRMERIILDKLQWNISRATPLDFLHIFHALLLSSQPHLLDAYDQMTPSRQLTVLTRNLHRVLCCHQVAAFRPAVVAIALLSLEMELFLPDWLGLTFMMETLVQENHRTIANCREVIDSALGKILQDGRKNYQLKAFSPSKGAKRKVRQLEEDNMYEGIKRLYNEDPAETTPVTMRSCGSEARQDTASKNACLSCVANY